MNRFVNFLTGEETPLYFSSCSNQKLYIQ